MTRLAERVSAMGARSHLLAPLTATERRVGAILADHLAEQYPGTTWRAVRTPQAQDRPTPETEAQTGSDHRSTRFVFSEPHPEPLVGLAVQSA